MLNVSSLASFKICLEIRVSIEVLLKKHIQNKNRILKFKMLEEELFNSWKITIPPRANVGFDSASIQKRPGACFLILDTVPHNVM